MEEHRLSRAELLSGDLNRSRRATKLLSAIESHCIYMRDESRRAVAAYLLEGGDDFERRFQGDYFASLKLKATSRDALVRHHLERYVPQWKSLIPADPELRARIIQLVLNKYGASPNAFAALGAADQIVQENYQRLFGKAIEQAHAEDGQESLQDRTGVTPQPWEDIEAGLHWFNLASGEILYRAGEPGDALYIIISGRMRVVRIDPDGSEHLIGELGRGEMIGELGAITGEPRSTTIRASRDSELVRLGREDLLRLAQKHIQVMIQINSLIARRIRKQYTQSAPAQDNVLAFALVPCDARVPLPDFGRAFVQALSQLGPTLYITSATLEDAIESGVAQATLHDPRNVQIVSWLSELESRYRYLVYEATTDVSEWSKRCIRQADHILLIGRASASPLPNPHELALLANQPKVDLVLLQNAGTSSPTGTATWLKPRTVRAHHHVRIDNPNDLARLARRLTGQSIALVLSGGGARGFGHIGALRAIHQAGLEVDEISGVSMGSLIGAGIAMGMDEDALKELALTMSSRQALLDRTTLPIISIYQTRKITSIIRNLTGAREIQDLWLPYFSVSCNLSTGNTFIHTEGALWLAVRASMAAAPIFTPINYNGDLLVDGGFLNNLPVDLMRERVGNATVLGIDCSPLSPKTAQYDFGPSISSWQALRYQLTPPERRKGPPNLAGVFSQIMDTNGMYRQKFILDKADLIVRLPARSWGMLDFEHCAEIIEVGYQATREQLAAWLATRKKN